VPEQQIQNRVASQRRTTLIGGGLAFVCAVGTELVLQHLGRSHPGLLNESAGRIALVFLSLYIVHRFSLAAFGRYNPAIKDMVCLTCMIFGTVILTWLGYVFAIGIATYLEKSSYLVGLAPESIHFAIPFAAGAMILQAVLGLQYGLVFALSMSIIAGVYLPSKSVMMPLILATSLVACLSLSRFRSRSVYTRAAFNVAMTALPFAMASLVIHDTVTAADFTVRLIAVLVSGFLCGFVAAGLTPIVEALGGYVTDMRLIEMATLDHPLLKELSVQAPGTWNHSMVIGMMVESAAEAVGANSVAARVGAYFHDIGKSKKPLYFVENQGGDENRHDKLSPSMSALIIRSHVKDGVELARKHKLPQVIEDMIPQHHGTGVIEYFYDKAVKEAGEDQTVDQSLYTYPGPKPQTKEAGILMLADGIEAASRTLTEPNLDRIQGLVQKMINKVFASGELDECELTLKDLHAIARAFTRVLNGIYHQRVAYAEPAEKVNRDAEPEAEAGQTDESGASKKPKSTAEERSTKEPVKEDLKRLGL